MTIFTPDSGNRLRSEQLEDLLIRCEWRRKPETSSGKWDSGCLRAIFRLAYHAGLRASEIGMLQIRDYDAKADKIFVHG